MIIVGWFLLGAGITAFALWLLHVERKFAQIDETLIRIRDGFDRVANIESYLHNGSRLRTVAELNAEREEADRMMDEKLNKPNVRLV